MLSPPPHLRSLREVIDRYDAIISDVWGVLHNGVVATSGAAAALAAARQAGKPVVLLTNAPRPPAAVAAQLAGFGIPSQSYDAIVSSGGVSREIMAQKGAQPFYHLGPSRDDAIYAGLGVVPATLEAARFILCTGLFDDETETAADYREMLEKACARGMEFICANPDLVVERGHRLIPCAGALAEMYERMGGKVTWVGKPKPIVYAHARHAVALALGRPVDAARILCLGDAFRTDIAGAIKAGHDCLMLLAGIHAQDLRLDGEHFDAGALAELARQNDARPTMTMVSLQW